MIPITPIPITSGIITLAALNLEHTKNFEMFLGTRSLAEPGGI